MRPGFDGPAIWLRRTGFAVSQSWCNKGSRRAAPVWCVVGAEGFVSASENLLYVLERVQASVGGVVREALGLVAWDVEPVLQTRQHLPHDIGRARLVERGL